MLITAGNLSEYASPGVCFWEDLAHGQAPRAARNEKTNDGTIVYAVIRSSNNDGTLDDTIMKAFDQDTATNLTFYDPSLKEQLEQTRYRGQ